MLDKLGVTGSSPVPPTSMKAPLARGFCLGRWGERGASTSGSVPSRHGDAACVLLVRATHGRGRGRPCQGLDLSLLRLPAAHRERVRGAGTLAPRAGAD